MTGNRVLRDIGWEVSHHDDLSIHALSSFGSKILPTLEDSLKRDFLNQIYEVVRSGFSQPRSEKLYADVQDHVNDHLLAVSSIDGRIVGFASVAILERLDTFYLHGIAIHAEFQSKKVGRRTMEALLNRVDVPRVAFTTQNPKMFCFLREQVARCFPSPEEQRVPDTEHTYGQALMADRKGVFDPETFVSKNLYSACLYPRIAPSGDECVNRWFQESLEMRDGQTAHGFLLCGTR